MNRTNILLRAACVAMTVVLSLATVPSQAATIQYTYDEAGRLTRADYGGGTAITYGYDANGNLLSRKATGGGEVFYTLIYRAGTGGTINGVRVITQQVAQGQSGAPVSAVAEDAGAVFARWSDGVTNASRTDPNVQADFDVQAAFRSTGGADLNWYAARGIAPEGVETWADVDARAVPAKGTTLRRENIADTDPGNPQDTFRVLAIYPGPPVSVTFRPGSTNRVYRLMGTDDLVTGAWTNVPGAGPRPGTGAGPDRQDTIFDENDPPAGPFYRIKVQCP
jgi:YD repeat-containing protein